MHVDGSQCLWGRLAALVSWCSLSPVVLAGVYGAETPNFRIVAPTPALARHAGVAAEAFREQVALEWLGRTLPVAPERTLIRLTLDPGPSQATTLVDDRGTDHHVDIRASDWQSARPLLHHEVAHTVLLTALGSAVPDWANEGIASRYDSPRRHEIRHRKLREFVELDSWPRLEALFESPIESQWSYAASVSVTDFLVSRRDQLEFIAFLTSIERQGLEPALHEHYGLSTAQLEQEWRNHVRAKLTVGRQQSTAHGVVLTR
jgi:hypothetical protein